MNNKISVNFQSVANSRYRIQSSDSINGPWANEGYVLVGNGQTMSASFDIQPVNKIYRVVEVEPNRRTMVDEFLAHYEINLSDGISSKEIFNLSKPEYGILYDVERELKNGKLVIKNDSNGQPIPVERTALKFFDFVSTFNQFTSEYFKLVDDDKDVFFGPTSITKKEPGTWVNITFGKTTVGKYYVVQGQKAGQWMDVSDAVAGDGQIRSVDFLITDLEDRGIALDNYRIKEVGCKKKTYVNNYLAKFVDSQGIGIDLRDSAKFISNVAILSDPNNGLLYEEVIDEVSKEKIGKARDPQQVFNAISLVYGFLEEVRKSPYKAEVQKLLLSVIGVDVDFTSADKINETLSTSEIKLMLDNGVLFDAHGIIRKTPLQAFEMIASLISEVRKMNTTGTKDEKDNADVIINLMKTMYDVDLLGSINEPAWTRLMGYQYQDPKSGEWVWVGGLAYDANGPILKSGDIKVSL